MGLLAGWSVVGAGFQHLLTVARLPAAVAVLLGGLTYVIELVVVRNDAVAMIFVTPLSVLLATSATGATAVVTITADRLLETVLDCLPTVAAGCLVNRRWAVRHRRLMRRPRSPSPNWPTS
ncbi:hypothetical protein [Streptomyces sp. S.PB5]|uniref:hypothetical protein n=1 Tax=Streptomyces sp. S.PB5 TaxID=3020844 RepID=UPI0025B0DAFC|nr:hypothetical protein [Streptomyces sp. S.PB5]MDN3028571.1 hypothetical protein [Streptomyces sp. S.PB5]